MSTTTITIIGIAALLAFSYSAGAVIANPAVTVISCPASHQRRALIPRRKPNVVL
jgi:hypothetical protein